MRTTAEKPSSNLLAPTGRGPVVGERRTIRTHTLDQSLPPLFSTAAASYSADRKRLRGADRFRPFRRRRARRPAGSLYGFYLFRYYNNNNVMSVFRFSFFFPSVTDGPSLKCFVTAVARVSVSSGVLQSLPPTPRRPQRRFNNDNVVRVR